MNEQFKIKTMLCKADVKKFRNDLRKLTALGKKKLFILIYIMVYL